MAIVSDAESSPEELDMEWSSDRDGVLPEGGEAASDGLATYATSILSEGSHAITLKVRDPNGLTGSDYVSINVVLCAIPSDEIENGLDDDCDGEVDEGLTCLPCVAGGSEDCVSDCGTDGRRKCEDEFWRAKNHGG